MRTTKKLRIASIALGIFLIFAALALETIAIPVGPQLSYISNTTTASAGVGTGRAGDEGGYITTINLSATQQNYAWKAYVGNVSGALTLENSGGQSIYEWLVPNVGQEVYLSRNGTVDWGTVNCSNRGNITQEDTDLNLNSSSSKSINKTFNASVHKSFIVAGKNIANSTCPAIATYISDAAQASSEAALFQEILLADASSNLIYAALIDQNQAGYDGSVYDFQAIVAEDETAGTPKTYYFYVELA